METKPFGNLRTAGPDIGGVRSHIGRMASDNELRPQAPFFAPGFPRSVARLSLAIVAVSLVQLLGPPRLTLWLMETGALISPGTFHGVDRPLGPYAPYVLHVFLHGGLFHLIMNMTAMIAFGPLVAKAFGRNETGFIAFFFFCAVTGGLAQMAVFDLQPGPGIAIGASSALSGLLPAAGYVMGGWRRAVQYSVPWLIINLGLAIGEVVISLPIAWAAHLGGLAGGFALPMFLLLFRRR